MFSPTNTGTDSQKRATDDSDAAEHCGPVDLLMEKQGCPTDAHHRLGELDLAHVCHRAEGQPSVPSEKPKEHAHSSEVGKRAPLDRTTRGWLLNDRDTSQDEHQRGGEHERPRDRLPRTQRTRKKSTLGVADRADDDSSEQQQIRPVQCRKPATLDHSEGDRCDRPDSRSNPKEPDGAFPSAQHREHRGRGGKESDHHGPMTRRRGGQGERRQEREPDHDASGDNGNLQPLLPTRPFLPGEPERGDREERRDHRTAGADEQRRHMPVLDGDTRERDSKRESSDTE